jgi:MSHA biogenesis protein MshI
MPPASDTTAFLPRFMRRGARAPVASVGVQWVDNKLAVVRVSDEARPHLVYADCVPAAERRTAAVRELLERGVLRHTRVVLTLTPGQYDVQYVTAPEVPEDELQDALRWQLRSTLSYSPDEAVLDYAVLPHADNAAGKSSVVVAAAHRSAIQEAVAPFIEAGVAVTAIDLPEFAQRNLARQLDRAAQAGAWLGFDRDTCLLTIHREGLLAFSRRMLLPGASMQAIDADLAPAAQHFAERVVTQVQRSLELFERQSGSPPLAGIAIGPHLHATAIARQLAERAGMHAEVIDPATLLERTAHTQGELDAAVMTALGAALRRPEAAQGLLQRWQAAARQALRRWSKPAAQLPPRSAPSGSAPAQA